jgi:hypothetical protein
LTCAAVIVTVVCLPCVVWFDGRSHATTAAGGLSLPYAGSGWPTGPTPLILQLVEHVLRLGPITVQLCDPKHFFFQRRYQHRVFVQIPSAQHLHRAEQLPLPVGVAPHRDRQRFPNYAP